MAEVHESPYCGSWYPGDRQRLTELLEALKERSESRIGLAQLKNPVGFVVPHAGLEYSGTVAQAAYRALRAARPKRVWLLGFSHSGGPDAVMTTDVREYATPLGNVAVEPSPMPFERGREEWLCDHSVEIQLPLLRHSVPDAQIIPLYVGRLDRERRVAAAERLASLYREGDVFVASSDFTHFGRAFGYQPFPVDQQTKAHLEHLDGGLMEAASSLDADYWMSALERKHATVCGREPIALLIDTMRRLPVGEVFQKRLDYQTSGDLTGDFAHSVSYAALGYYPASSFAVDEREQRLLIESSIATLDRLFRTGDRDPVVVEEPPAALDARIGAFVTLYRKGELCGCIGRLEPSEPLRELIPELTLSAALDDYRFEHGRLPVEDMQVEVSLLTPLKPVQSAEAFVLGEHGAVLESGSHRALLLPQVAEEYGLSRDDFFRSLGRKAGLEWDKLRDGEYKLSVFRAARFTSGRVLS
ncbi:MAG: AmmeMemoRadiSam system protein B [Bryobacterales bacterium]|nr:AmmeMemoRadiSam system protein B [Bryobacterales bacterium]